MFRETIIPAPRAHRAPWVGGLYLALVVLSALVLGGCAPQASTSFPPATSLAVTAALPVTYAPPPTAAPATAVPPTIAPRSTAASRPSSQPTRAPQSAANVDLLVTIAHTNDVGGETDPCG